MDIRLRYPQAHRQRLQGAGENFLKLLFSLSSRSFARVKLTAAASAIKRRSSDRVPSSLKAAHKDGAKKLGSLSPERYTGPAKTARPQSSTATVKAKPPISARGPALPKASAVPTTKEALPEEGADVSGKAGVWMEAQQAFGFETPRPSESRRCSQAGEPTPATATAVLGAGFGDDGDPNTVSVCQQHDNGPNYYAIW